MSGRDGSLAERVASAGRLAAGLAGFTASLGVAALCIAGGAGRETITAATTSRMSRWTLAGGRVRLRVAGREHLSADPRVYVANHQSFLDYPIMASVFPRRCIVVARRSILRMPVVGALYRRSGHALLDRDDPGAARRTLDALAERMRGEGVSVWMFPEGTRNRGDGRRLTPFKSGAFHLAVAAGVPVTPIVLSPLRPALDLERGFIGPSRPVLHVLPPEPPSAPAREMASRVRARMQRVLLEQA